MSTNEPATKPQISALALHKQLCFGLYAASHLMTKAYRPHLKQIGLTYPQFLVMLVLWENGSQTVSDIGAALLLDSGTLSPLLKRLEAAHLIVKVRHQRDERQVIVNCTEQGLALRVKAENARKQMCDTLGLTDAEIAMMRLDLNKLIDVLTQIADPYD